MRTTFSVAADDVFFFVEVHGADQLHSLEIGAAELGHHTLVLAGVEHAHEDSLDDIVVVVSQGDLVAAVFFCEAVEIAAAHAGAQIAGGLFDGVDGVKDIGAADLDGNTEQLRVFFDELSVLCQIPGIHAQKDQGKRKLVVALEFLKEFGHQHGVLAAGNTDRDPVALLHELILYDSLFKAADQIMLEGPAQGLVHIASVFFNIKTGFVNIYISVINIHISKDPLLARKALSIAKKALPLVRKAFPLVEKRFCRPFERFYHSISCSVYFSSQ